MKYRTEWNLGLLYKNENDPQIEKDLKDLESLCALFEKKYRGKIFSDSSKSLLQALEEYQKLSDSRFYKPFMYFFLRKELNANDSIAQAKMTVVEQRVTNASSKVTFFILELGKISSSLQKKYLADVSLKDFWYYLQKNFEKAKYNLSEPEEQLHMQLAQTSETMWANAQQKLLGNQVVTLDGKKISISEARARLAELPLKKRYKLLDDINKASKKISFMAEAELNAIYTFHKITNERRGFKTPYSASVLSKESTDKEIEQFTHLITSYYPLSHRFHKIHTKLLGLKKLRLADRRVSIGKIKRKFDFDNTYRITRAALSRAGDKYGHLLEVFLKEGQIDIFPRKGKQAGGFHMHIGTLPSFILLNHTDDIQSVETLAHEMGHAIHSHFSKKLPKQYQEYSTATAEVASTFFEQFVALELESKLSDEEKFIMLHRKLYEDMYLIFAQIACFNYELELHEYIATHGQATAQQMAQMMQKHMQAYTGNAMNVTEDDGYLFVLWHHLRYNFYTYTYAYGGLLSRSLFEIWKKDNTYIEKIDRFLSAGGSNTPTNIFKSIGITTDVKFFEAGLKGIEADIDKLEKLSKNWLKKKVK